MSLIEQPSGTDSGNTIPPVVTNQLDREHLSAMTVVSVRQAVRELENQDIPVRQLIRVYRNRMHTLGRGHRKGDLSVSETESLIAVLATEVVFDIEEHVRTHGTPSNWSDCVRSEVRSKVQKLVDELNESSENVDE